jgi:hypothetical protein
MFRASICPPSGVLGCIRCILLHTVFSTVKENFTLVCGFNEQHKMKPPANAVHFCSAEHHMQ